MEQEKNTYRNRTGCQDEADRKPGSVPPQQQAAMIIPLGHTLPYASSDRTRRPRASCSYHLVVRGGAKWECLSIWSCSGWGLPSFQCHHWNWCALTAPFHPYHGTACGPAAGRITTGNVWPWCTLAGRFVFCGTFLRVTPTGRYPAPCSVEPGLSSPRRVTRSDHLIPFVL